jgi:hypothetical protein
MGLYDEVTLDYALPDLPLWAKGLRWQTKSLDPGMLRYRVTVGGQLRRMGDLASPECENRRIFGVNGTQVPHTGAVEIHTNSLGITDGEPEFLSYVLMFDKGVVKFATWVKVVK